MHKNAMLRNTNIDLVVKIGMPVKRSVVHSHLNCTKILFGIPTMNQYFTKWIFDKHQTELFVNLDIFDWWVNQIDLMDDFVKSSINNRMFCLVYSKRWVTFVGISDLLVFFKFTGSLPQVEVIFRYSLSGRWYKFRQTGTLCQAYSIKPRVSKFCLVLVYVELINLYLWIRNALTIYFTVTDTYTTTFWFTVIVIYKNITFFHSTITRSSISLFRLPVSS